MKQKLNAKDFILIGVLTALMWIICMIISTIMSVAGPVTNVFYPSVVAIPNGIVMMLLLAKVPKKGVFTICAAIQAILFLLVGAFWFIPIGLVIGGIICDFLVMGRKEITMKSMMVAYALFSAIFAFSAICPIKFLQSAFVGAMEKNNIAPEYIEGMLEKARKEVETTIREEGESATFDTGVNGLHPELVKLLGKLKYRTSYGQNVLKHSIEVSHLAGLMAAELGVDVVLAKRAGLLHDIGKSVDHEMEGSHVSIGVGLLKRYKENHTVINAVEAHHGDVEPQSIIAVLVQAADAISAARPGARRETLESYIKRLQKLEEIADSFKGVEKSFAIQAGRELRIMIVPEDVTDEGMTLLAREIAKKIEEELEYPGQIKVNLVRETRAVEYAK